jgi:hypothetical protein
MLQSFIYVNIYLSIHKASEEVVHYILILCQLHTYLFVALALHVHRYYLLNSDYIIIVFYIKCIRF